MIASVSRGSSTLGLLTYLYGPGEHNEHTDPHIVGSWDGFTPDPGRHPDTTLAQLRKALDLRVLQAGAKAPKEHVWHCSVRADPGDRHLGDREWDRIARRVVAAAGIAPDGDPDGCRWIAVRHAEDHIHILATLMRGNLTQPRIRGDWPRIEAELTRIEHDLGLTGLAHTRTPGRRRTTPKRPTRPEQRKARRRSLDHTPREALRTAVRQSLAGAAGEEEFLARLAGHGVRVSIRRAPSGDPIGYKFALPGDRNGRQEPVWFSGSTLAPDLSLPRIRARLAVGADQPRYSDPDPRTRPAAARRQAGTTVDHSTATLVEDQPDDSRAAATISGSIEILDALAATSTVLTRKEIAQAARALDRTVIAHTRAATADLRAMRSAARALLTAGPALGRDEDGAATAAFLSGLVLLAILIAKQHSACGHQHQAQAARTAADHLRTAYTRQTAKPLAALTTRGRHLPRPVQDRQATAVRQALPTGLATQILDDPHWPALAATLSEAETAGHNALNLLTRTTGHRELTSADSAAAVLTWRIRRDTHLPSTPTPPHVNAARARTRTTAASGAVTPATAPARTQPPPPPRRPAR
ncbi:hypothetical protein [Streptomyces sp. NPDC001380]|uniref:hypothetical protein n=1 Tax=Streptomyces sp. NPDC001380 TaxID=3364566 RepID=UPI003681B224